MVTLVERGLRLGTRIAVINQKGGVGKTTTAINVAAYVAKAGKRVLVVDADPQGNATSGLGFDKQNLKTGTYDVMLDIDRLPDAVYDLSFENLSLIGSNHQLSGAEIELVSAENRESRLKAALDQVSHDLIFIDCPPALGLLTINALVAADFVLIPVQAEYYALEGLSQLLTVVQRVKGTMNPDLAILGVVLTMYDGRNSLAEQVAAEVQKHFGKLVFKTRIPRNVRLAEAPSYGKPVMAHDKWSKGARAYKQLAKELLVRVI